MQAAGVLAGLTVAVAATPVELVKVKLQMQLQPTTPLPLFSSATVPAGPAHHSPLGFAKLIYQHNGILGFWHAVGGTMLQRMWFGVMFGAYDVEMRYWQKEVSRNDGSFGPRLPVGTANFIAGGTTSSQLSIIRVHTYDPRANFAMCPSPLLVPGIPIRQRQEPHDGGLHLSPKVPDMAFSCTFDMGRRRSKSRLSRFRAMHPARFPNRKRCRQTTARPLADAPFRS